ncbi:hypothetical protein LZZ85_00895 [Terrimonas sp. NA20]|uniref:Uncharacterized protein n=1 Tax=Terrimonas ginsenosidimutans TaxID=2908004 RepID=A0ABS9KKF0_9BACT|nr:hypothetical protein [Terrimonas ginsenosidimutans]MCG2612808.1 hypothetical protein [Terrimonas ginsenosidimutans]
MIEIPVIDQVIIADVRYYNFAEQDQMAELPRKEIMHVTIEMNTSSLRRITMRKKMKRRFV